MKKSVLGSWVCFVLLAAPGLAQDTAESITKELLGLMKESLTVLKTVKDGDTAKAAMPRMEKLKEKIIEVSKRAAKVPPPSDKEKEGLEKYKKEGDAVVKELDKEGQRILQIKGAEDLIKLLELKKTK